MLVHQHMAMLEDAKVKHPFNGASTMNTRLDLHGLMILLANFAHNTMSGANMVSFITCNRKGCNIEDVVTKRGIDACCTMSWRGKSWKRKKRSELSVTPSSDFTASSTAMGLG